MQKSSICQNDQNFMNIKYINVYTHINAKKVQYVKMIRIL